MPTVLRLEGFRFFIFSDEGNEPAHIHARKQDCVAKFWLSPVSLASNEGFNMATLNRLHRLVRANRDLFLEKWNEHLTR